MCACKCVRASASVYATVTCCGSFVHLLHYSKLNYAPATERIANVKYRVLRMRMRLLGMCVCLCVRCELSGTEETK